jgi:hypothetical protein
MSTYKAIGFETRRIEATFWVEANNPEEASNKIRGGLASRVEYGESVVVEVGHGELEGPRVLGDLALTDEEFRILDNAEALDPQDPDLEKLVRRGFVRLDHEDGWPTRTSRGLTALNFHRVSKARQEEMGREATRQQVEKGARTARIIDIHMRNKGTS